jgi:DDE superfamily endonuclease
MIVVKDVVGPVLTVHSIEVLVKAEVLRDSRPAIIENLENTWTEIRYLWKGEGSRLGFREGEFDLWKRIRGDGICQRPIYFSGNDHPGPICVGEFGKLLHQKEFCHENNIILCRLPSHTSHKLQPCDVGMFGPLKTAYRERVEELYRGGANTVSKQHFTSLYSQARCAAFTSRNIKSAWAKAGLYPWNPDRVLRDTQKPPSQEPQGEYTIDAATVDKTLQTPVTAESLTSLRRKIEQNMPTLDDHNQQCLRKLANAAERAMTARDLYFKENFDLFKQNNESRTRESSNSNMVGKAKL